MGCNYLCRHAHGGSARLQSHERNGSVLPVSPVASVGPAAISVATLAGAGKITTTKAALPILIALTTNAITKAVLTITSGGLGFALRVIPGLVLVIMAG